LFEPPETVAGAADAACDPIVGETLPDETLPDGL
jgi:hypothetical protein